MKKTFTIWLAALAMLFASAQAHAALTVNLQWNIAGSVEIYVGGTNASNKVQLPAGATSYTASIDNTWGTTYIAKTDGYEFSSVKVGGVALNPISNGMYKIDMDTNNGKTVVITAEKLQYDGEFNINVINGRDKLNVVMWGTNRQIKVHTGANKIPYSTKFEPGVNITAPALRCHKILDDDEEDPEAVEFYLLQDGEDLGWANNYGTLSVTCFTEPYEYKQGCFFEEGTNFEVRYWDTEDGEEIVAETANVTLNYADNTARSAVILLFNVTQNKSIPMADTFTVNKGDKVRLVLNTFDYDFTIDGLKITPAAGESTPYEFVVSGDTTRSLQVSERQYGTTTIRFAIADLNGVTLRDGAIDGPIIDKSRLTAGSTFDYTYDTFFTVEAGESAPAAGDDDYVEVTAAQHIKKTVTLTTYTYEVSLKLPKVFISEAAGYWIAASEYDEGSDKIPAGVASTGYTLNVVNKPITPDTHVSIYLACDGSKAKADNVLLRDRNRNTYTLKAGYNEFTLDGEYSTPLTASLFDCAEGTAFAVFKNMEGVPADSNNEGSYAIQLNGELAAHIFAGRKPAATYQVSAVITPDSEAEIVADRARRFTSSATFDMFKGCEIAVSPAQAPYFLNGEEQTEYAGLTHTFKIDNALDDEDMCNILLGNIAKMVVTPNSDIAEEFTGFAISFPAATTATFNAELLSDVTFSDLGQSYFACTTFNVSQVNGAEVPTFFVRPALLPTRSGTYHFVIPAGLFTINGELSNEDDICDFSLTANVDINAVPVIYNPTLDRVPVNEFPGANIIFGSEIGQYGIEIGDLNKISVTVGGTVWTRGEDYTVEVEQNFAFIQPAAPIAITGDTEFTVAYEAGAFLVEGKECLAGSHTWTLIQPKSFTPVVVGPKKPNYLTQLQEIYIAFEGSTQAEMFNPNGIRLQHATTRNTYDEAATIEATDFTTESGAPIFKLSFAKAPSKAAKYVLDFHYGTFLLDGAYNSPEDKITTTNRLVTMRTGAVTDMTLVSNGTDAADLTEFVATFPYASYVSVNEALVGDIVFCDNPQSKFGCQSFTVENISDADAFKFAIRPAMLPTRAGNYRIDLPEGLFTINSTASKAQELNFELTSAFNINNVPVLTDPTFDSMSINDFGYMFMLMFGEEYGDYNVVPVDLSSITATYGDAQWVLDQNFGVEPDGNTLMIFPYEDMTITEPTQFTLTIPAGAFTIEGEPSLEFTHTWTFLPGEYKVSFDKMAYIEGANQFETVYITYEGANELSIDNPDGITLVHESGKTWTATIEIVTPRSAVRRAPSAGTDIKLTFSPKPDLAGSYELNIAEGTFKVDGAHKSAAQTAKFSNLQQTAILDAVLDGEGRITIVDLQGRIISLDADADTLRTLQRGIYIVNGRKVRK